jgi:hypothetical protein
MVSKVRVNLRPSDELPKGSTIESAMAKESNRVAATSFQAIESGHDVWRLFAKDISTVLRV